MTERIALDDLTSDQLDQLYDRVERLRRSRNRWADHAGRLIGRTVTAESRTATLEQRVTELTAGQCTHTRRMCDLHHRVPVTDCPYPKCVAARGQAEEASC